MRPVKFEEANVVMKAPPGEEENVFDMPAFRDKGNIVSCWELTDEEVEEIVKTKRIYALMKGIQPPMLLQIDTPFVQPCESNE